MFEYWSRSNHLSYVGKTRGKFSELLTSFFSLFQHFFFSLGEDVCYMFISFCSKENGLSFGRCDFWDCFWGGQALVMIGQWYSRQPW